MRSLIPLCILPLLLSCAFGSANRRPESLVDAPISEAPGLNHLYVVLEKEAFEAIKADAWFLREFAAVDTGLPAFDAPTSESQGLYVRGEHTYLELLGPENRFGEPVGKVGIALGPEDLEALDHIEARWRERLDGEVQRVPIEWTRSDPPVPWYDAAFHASTADNPHLVMWAAAYAPAFVPWLHPGHHGASRRDVLAPSYAPDRILKDLREVVVAAPPDLRERLTAQLEAIDFVREDLDDRTALTGAGWRLILIDATDTAPPGLRSLLLQVNSEAVSAPTRRALGKTVLQLGSDGVARWELRSGAPES